MGAVFLTLLHMSLAASALVVVVVVLRLLLKRAPKAIHCALWAMVALRLLLPFSVESSFSLIPQDVAERELLTEWQDDYVGDVTVIYDDSALYNDAVAAGREPFADGEGGYYVVTAPDRLDAPDTVETAVLPILGWVWLMGCAAMLLYAAVSFFRIRRRVRLSVPLRDNIWRCEAVDSPFILGFFRPNIYLPYDMDEGQAQYVIAHEEAHLRRRDHWWKPLGFLLLAVYWFNPLLWVAYILLCRDIELACDERVIRDMDASAKKAYSEALLSCSLPRHMVAACPLAFGEVGVKKRIASVLHYKKPAFWVLVVAILACVVVAVCFLTNPKDTIGGKVYTYEKSGVLGNFTIAFFEDGTFHYTEGMASSYHSSGKWTEKGNILTLTDDDEIGYKLVNRFRKDGDTLYFIAEGSSNFLYVTVQDGERFTYTFDIEQPTLDGVDGMQSMLVPSYSIVDGVELAEGIFSRVDTSYPEEMLAYLCQADLWDDAIKEHAEILMPGNFDITVMFSQTPSDSDALDVAMARRAYLLMRLYPDEVFSVMWSYPDGNGGRINRALHADEASAIASLSSHTETFAVPDSAKRVEHQLGFLSSLEEKLFLKFSALDNEFSFLYEDDNTAAQLFDTILSSPADGSKPADYLKAHSNEHNALLSDENTTLRYIFTEFLKGNQPEPKGQLMRIVLDELAPEAQLRLYAETGQEYFDEWIKGADRVATDHGLEWMQHNQPNMYLALQIRSEIYGHSFPVIPTNAPELPEPLKLEGEKQQAACNAILASLRTGWWTGGRTLNPAKEAAAFTCFHHETVGDEVNLYGFGGYFSQDAQGNAADEWSSFTIVTLNKTTLDLIQVWWPGDGAYHDMSIEENFIDYLVEPVIMISPEDYQDLQKALRKQAAENMAPVGLSHASVKTQCPTIDGVEIHTPGSYITSEWRQSERFDEAIHCHYDVQWDHAICLRCGTPFSYETAEESYATHRKEVTYNEDGSEKGFTCLTCGYRSW